MLLVLQLVLFFALIIALIECYAFIWIKWDLERKAKADPDFDDSLGWYQRNYMPPPGMRGSWHKARQYYHGL